MIARRNLPIRSQRRYIEIEFVKEDWQQ